MKQMSTLAQTGNTAAASLPKTLRVLHVNSGRLYGGVEAILMTLARLRHLCPEMDSHFAVCYEGRLSQELMTTGVPVHVLGKVRVSRPWTVLRARRRMQELLRRQRFDVVVCHMTWAQAIFGPVVRSSKLPLVFYLHNRMEGRHWSERWARIAAIPDLVLCVSHDTARTCRNIYPTANSRVIYSPMPWNKTGHFENERPEVRTEFQTPADATVIVQVSRMEAWKGQSSLLEALGRLRERRDWTCWIVGGAQTAAEASYAASLKSLAADLGIADRIRFLGERADVPRILAAADIFCQPNRSSEGFSIVFMEAFLASLPIVTTAIGGAMEMVNDSCGVLLPMNDMDALTEALRTLIESPRLRSALGDAGRRRVYDLCDPATQMRSLREVLADLASRQIALFGSSHTLLN